MEIEVGEYVRTFNGLIGKVVELTDSGNYAIRIYNGAEYVVRAVIKNHSKNIIDLIEVGDIVKLDDEFIEYRLIDVFDESIIEGLKQDIKTGIKINSILTKEQYESNCYTVERKKDES